MEIPLCKCGHFEDDHIDGGGRGCFNCNYEQKNPNLKCNTFEQKYLVELGQVESAKIGFQREDACFLGIQVCFDFGGSGQCFSSGIFDSYDKKKNRRVGTDYGCDYIVQFLEYFGIGDSSQLVGKYIYAVREKHGDYIKGFLLNKPDFRKVSKYDSKRKYKPFLNDEIAKEWGIGDKEDE